MGYNSAPGGYGRTTYGRNAGNFKVLSHEQEEQIETRTTADEVPVEGAQEEVSALPILPEQYPVPLRDYTLSEYRSSFVGPAIEPSIPNSFGVQEKSAPLETNEKSGTLTIEERVMQARENDALGSVNRALDKITLGESVLTPDNKKDVAAKLRAAAKRLDPQELPSTDVPTLEEVSQESTKDREVVPSIVSETAMEIAVPNAEDTQEGVLVGGESEQGVIERTLNAFKKKDLATVQRHDDLAQIAKTKQELGGEISNEERERVINNEQVISQTYEMINKAPELSGVNLEEAPFINYAENDETSWKYVPNNEIESYLGKKLFLNTQKIVSEDMVKVAETNRFYNERPLQIPVDLIVNAAGFKSWKGREVSSNKTWKSSYGDGEAKSLEVIKHYAGLPTELPPVGIVQMYIQPDGKVFFDNNGGDSHRIAAAILRGKKYIEATNVITYKLNKNYILDSTLPVSDSEPQPVLQTIKEQGDLKMETISEIKPDNPETEQSVVSSLNAEIEAPGTSTLDTSIDYGQVANMEQSSIAEVAIGKPQERVIADIAQKIIAGMSEKTVLNGIDNAHQVESSSSEFVPNKDLEEKNKKKEAALIYVEGLFRDMNERRDHKYEPIFDSSTASTMYKTIELLESKDITSLSEGDAVLMQDQLDTLLNTLQINPENPYPSGVSDEPGLLNMLADSVAGLQVYFNEIQEGVTSEIIKEKIRNIASTLEQKGVYSRNKAEILSDYLEGR